MSGELPYSDRVQITTGRLDTGERILRHQALINAGLKQVWEAFTTSQGLMSFAAPFVNLDFRVGGTWESSYERDAQPGDPANIINEILSYLPMEMLSIRIKQTPPGFPHPEIGKQLWTVNQFEACDKRRTQVTTTMLGWQEGPEWEEVFEMFKRGNALTLGWLYERFEHGSRDWS
jgi:uncharacterized protein YndB with AHSA1/START domain